MARNLFLALVIVLMASACNLAGAPSQEQIAQTATAELTGAPSRTPLSTSGIPTTFPVAQPTSLPTFLFPTAIVSFPTSVPPVIFPTSVPPAIFPTNTQLPVSIVILSPVPGNIVAGNVQILGSAIYPQFLQYQVEYGPDPNPSNLWFPATSAVTSPVLNGLLGIWNTTITQDAKYQLRLRVYLRDGTLLTTVVNNITVQNHINTPIPSSTPNVPRPIAAFTQDKAAGDVPLTVHFINQSSGTINAITWNFGDANSSNEVNPQHTFGAPGLYTVTLTVSGPGGSSNVSRQINVTSPTAPVAGFTQDQATGLAPLTVHFQNQSTGSITSYQWSFSDGSTSSEQNPTHTFVQPGTYNVFLTVSGPGGSSSVTRQINVTSPVPPTATFTSTFTPTFTPTITPTPTNSTTPVTPTPTFTSTATFTPTASFTATATPTNTTTPVPPTATLTPSDTTTAVPPTATNTNTEVPPPQAMFAASVAPNDPLTVQFTDQSTGQIAQWSWDFGDGGTSDQQSPSHRYSVGGSYTVTLTVIDLQSRASQFAGVVTVVEPANANFSAQPTDLNVQFIDQSTGQIVQWAWDFGDGSGSQDQNPKHTYAAAGTYTVTLTVTDANGRTSQAQQQVSVTAPIQANFTAQPTDLSVQFVDQSTGQVAQWAWDFGDGGGSQDQNPQHTYATAGTYPVTFTVTDPNGRSSQAQQQVTVTAPIQANFSAQPTDLTVHFVDQSVGQIVSWAWDFGDGVGSSTDQNPQYTYAQAGTYTVTLTVTDPNGRTSQAQQQVTLNAPIQAAFAAQPTDLTVQFVDQSTGQVAQWSWDFGDGSSSQDQNPQHLYAAGGSYTVTLMVTDPNGKTSIAQQQVSVTAPVQANFAAQPTDLSIQLVDQSSGQIAQWNWDFGDGSGSQDQNPQHSYASAGTYTVTLTVTDSEWTFQPVPAAGECRRAGASQLHRPAHRSQCPVHRSVHRTDRAVELGLRRRQRLAGSKPAAHLCAAGDLHCHSHRHRPEWAFQPIPAAGERRRAGASQLHRPAHRSQRPVHRPVQRADRPVELGLRRRQRLAGSKPSAQLRLSRNLHRHSHRHRSQRAIQPIPAAGERRRARPSQLHRAAH